MRTHYGVNYEARTQGGRSVSIGRRHVLADSPLDAAIRVTAEVKRDYELPRGKVTVDHVEVWPDPAPCRYCPPSWGERGPQSAAEYDS